MCQAAGSVLDLTRELKEEQSSCNRPIGFADHVQRDLLDAGVPRIQDVRRQNISGVGLKAFVLHILPNDIGVRSHMVTPWTLLVQIPLSSWCATERSSLLL